MAEQSPFKADFECLSNAGSHHSTSSSWSSTVTCASCATFARDHIEKHDLENPFSPVCSAQPIYPTFPPSHQTGRIKRFFKAACSFSGARRRRVRFRKQPNKSNTSEESSIFASSGVCEYENQEPQSQAENPFQDDCGLPETQPNLNPFKNVCTKWNNYLKTRERRKCEKSIAKQEKRIKQLEKSRAPIKQMDAGEGKNFTHPSNDNNHSWESIAQWYK